MTNKSNPPVSVRMAAVDDAESLESLLREAFAEYEPLYTIGGYAATTPAAELLRNRLRDGPTWVAFRGETLVGTVSAVTQGKTLYVRSMAVLPAARGQRIGKLLLQHVENFAADHGCQRLRLNTTPFLASAIRLYERLGFRRSKEGPHDLFGTPLFTMTRAVLPVDWPNVRETAHRTSRRTSRRPRSR